MLQKVYQVVIVGAGPVGASLACALAKSPYVENILLLEKQQPKLQFSSIPDQRVYSINPSSYRFFDSLGITNKMHLDRLGKLRNIQVWNDDSRLDFQQSDKEGALSWVIENNNIVKGLHDTLLEPEVARKVRFQCGADIDTIGTSKEYVSIRLKSGEQLSAKLLVGSDGNRSKVKELSRIKTHGWSYNQMGIVCTLQLDSNITTAFQRYYDNNVLAVLPLWNNYASIVWSAQIPLYEHLIKLKDEEFKKQLLQNLYSRNSPTGLPFVRSILNKRLAFPLMSLQAERYTGSRVALVGDAAHSIHPMAGLGVNSGFADSIMLANNIISNKKAGHDIGDEMSLKNYEVDAKKLNKSNSLAMELIKKGFEFQHPIIRAARKTVLGLLNTNPTVKQALTHAAKDNPFVPTHYEWEN